MKAEIFKLYFNPYGYLITFENIPSIISRLHSTFTEFDEIKDRSVRQEVFLRADNLIFIMNYKFLRDIEPITLRQILEHCTFLDETSKEYIKLQHV